MNHVSEAPTVDQQNDLLANECKENKGFACLVASLRVKCLAYKQ
ncbi:hypothetical protein [Spartinivicinus poritis]|uniref:Uncharacterized protein n=1 Tax=Spartinivicinus poritis TaxID=2994640 RepID=A0ABT5UBU8_9GAMM|nr:hypothetical protein [Spartinivicinus sp. A2-2]MDE1463456.1 hypothetical protein [Spartinivicinus sp. A2-2]